MIPYRGRDGWWCPIDFEGAVNGLTSHEWEVELVESPIDDCEFWKCKKCGASGGDVAGICSWLGRDKPFLAGTHLKLSVYCNFAQLQVAAFKLGQLSCQLPHKKEQKQRCPTCDKRARLSEHVCEAKK